MNLQKLPFVLATAATLLAQADVTLQRAMRKETLEGDLKGAIELYRKTVAEARNDRATAAMALIRMAECHQKLGDAESRKIYERVLREYADQKEPAATARARLGNTTSMIPAKGDRVVWAGKDVAHDGAAISPDGRLLSYTDWFWTGDLMLHDLSSGADRQLTGIPGSKNWSMEGNSHGSAFSRDGKQVAYGWLSYSPRRSEVRIVSVDGSGIPQPRRVLANDEIAHLAVSDWSPDQKLLAVTLEGKDRAVRIGLVQVQDGSLHVLKSVSWRGPTKLFFSPDSKYVAYDLPASDTALQRDVFVIAVDGSQDTAVAVHPANEVAMGWSPDGRHLLFASDRTGPVGLWAIPVANGKPAAAPKLLKPDIGKASPLGLTAAGTLHFFKNTSTSALHAAPIDLASGKLLGAPAVQAYDSRGHEWSPDGKLFAYVSRSDKANILSIRSEETGQVRQLPQAVTYMSPPHWSPDSRWLIAGARDLKGTPGIYRFDVQTGAVSFLAPGSHSTRAQVSPDGKKIYYPSHPDWRRALVEYDLATGKARPVFQPAEHVTTGNFELSPDGRYAATVTMQDPDRSTGQGYGTTALLLIRIDGSAPRELLRARRPEAIEGWSSLNWTPDGKALTVLKSTGERKELWMVPIEGSPRKLDIDISHWAWGQIRLHPDGRQIAFYSGEESEEIWALENFLPGLRASR